MGGVEEWGGGLTYHFHQSVLLLKLNLLKTSKIYLVIHLNREVHSRIIGCQSQLKLFKFFYDMHLSQKLCLTTGK